MKNIKNFLNFNESYVPISVVNDLDDFYKIIKDQVISKGDIVYQSTGIFPFDPAIQNIQVGLNFLGYDLPIYGIDGEFGQETREAVIEFEKDNGIEGAGIINVNFIEKLFSVLKEMKFSVNDLISYKSKYENPMDDGSNIIGTVSTSITTGEKSRNIELIKNALIKRGITNPYTIKAILSVIGKESDYIPKEEKSYKNTSNSRIRKIFGSRVSGLSDSELDSLKSNDLDFWDRVYGIDDPTGRGKKYGNTKKGDGYKYSGRGFNQLTYKKNYEKYNKDLRKNGVNFDIVGNPDLVNKPEIAAEVVASYFDNTMRSQTARRKYGAKDPNDYKDFETALMSAANANAGYGKDMNRGSGRDEYENSLAYSLKFELGPITNLA